MKDSKDRCNHFCHPWIIGVLIMILAASSLPGAGRYSCAWNRPSVSGQATEDLIKQGDALVQEHLLDEAIAAYTKAIELNPKNGVAFRKRGEVKHLKSDYENAVADYGKAILLDPLDHAAYYGRSKCQLVLRRFPESLEDCETSISLNPQNSEAFFLRSMIKQATNDNAGAIQDLSQAIALNPSSAVYFNVRASVKQEMADDKGAIADYSRSLEIKPNEWAVLTSRAELLLKTGDPKAALKDIKKALEIEPGNQKARDLLKEIESATAAGGPAPTSAKPAATQAVRVSGSMNPPQLIRQIDPEYPAVAHAARVQGIVILEVTIDETGKVVDVQILRSIPLLDEAAIAAVKQRLYEPYLINGVPTKIIATVTVNFTLKMNHGDTMPRRM